MTGQENLYSESKGQIFPLNEEEGRRRKMTRVIWKVAWWGTQLTFFIVQAYAFWRLVQYIAKASMS